MSDDTLAVSEVFGPTIQGEGPAAGQTAAFLRLMGCNLSCSWCDTPYTWDASRHDLRAETRHRTAAELAAELEPHPGVLVVTGGEPLLQQDRPAFTDLLALMAGQRRPVHIETNGTISPSWDARRLVDLFVVSPKLGHAGEHRGHQNPQMHGAWRCRTGIGRAVLKVVVRTPEDVAAAATLAREYRFAPADTYVMPEGRTAAELAARWPAVCAEATRHGLSASHRLHVLAWGDERGH